MKVKFIRTDNITEMRDEIADSYLRKGKVKVYIDEPPQDMSIEKAPKLVSVEKSETEQLRKRIGELEGQAAKQRDQVEALRQQLSEYVAAGEDASESKRKLQEAKDELSSIVDAVRVLDKRLVDVSATERSEAITALQISVANKYRELVGEFQKSVDALSTKVNKVLGDHAANVPARLNKVLREAAWEAANHSYSEDYLKFVPRTQKHAPRRNDDGTIAVEPVRARVPQS